MAIQLPTIVTRIMRGTAPGDGAATELMRYLDASAAQRVNHLLNAAESTTGMAVSPDGRSIYLDPITVTMTAPYRSARAALAAGWPIDIDALAARAP